MAIEDFRSPYDPLGIFQLWWGEPLSEDSYEKAIRAPSEQQQEFQEFAISESLRTFEVPSLQRGMVRPLLVNAEVYYPEYDDYLSAAATLALYVDEVAVEYIFGAHYWNLSEWLGYLLTLKPLAEIGAIRFFFPNVEMYREIKINGQINEVLNDIQSSPWRERFLETIGRSSLIDTDAVFLALWQLNRKSARPRDTTLIAKNAAEDFLFGYLTGAPSGSPEDRNKYALAKLIALRVPLYAINIQSLIKVRKSESVFEEWRNAVRNALYDIEGLPDGSEDWQEQAREIAAEELFRLENKIDRITRTSPALAKAKAGLSGIAFSAAGAAAGMAVGGDFRSDFIGAAAAETLHVSTEYWRAVTRRRELNAVKDLIVTFVTPPQGLR